MKRKLSALALALLIGSGPAAQAQHHGGREGFPRGGDGGQRHPGGGERQPGGGGQPREIPRRETPRQEHPRQERPRQDPPRRELPRENPRRENPGGQLPGRVPDRNRGGDRDRGGQLPGRLPDRTPRQPDRNPGNQNPGRLPDRGHTPDRTPDRTSGRTPGRSPWENPRQNPRRDNPRQEHPRTDPRDGRRPPVIVPRDPGQGRNNGRGRVMPVPPRGVERGGGLLDPRRNGDGRAYTPPNRRWDGGSVTQRPWQNNRGRWIPPGRDHITIINNTVVINNIDRVHRGWNTNDHGYGWYDWNGYRTCHHYDTYGYHWWGFYVGDVYFWTRYHNGRHWWYDPYWHRWTYLHDGRWWWQDPAAPAVVYVIIDDNYYRYEERSGSVVVRPDTTPPVDAPPAENQPSSPEKETVYSADGTRSVQILGTGNDAYLYDLTKTDPNNPGSGGKWLASGVKSAKFVYDDKHEADGSTSQVIRQVELDYDDPLTAAVVDADGERKVLITGNERSAYLYDLEDENKASAYLADGVSEVKMVNGDDTLKMIVVTAKTPAGADTFLMFDRDGGDYDPSATEAPAPAPKSFRDSAAFNMLNSGGIRW